MVKKRDFYEVLGIKKDANQSAIKKAYRKLAKQFHPDTNKGDAAAEERFKEITEAYDILSDAKKKKLYDQYGLLAFECGFDEEVLKKATGPYAGFGTGFGSGNGPGRYKETYFQGDEVDMEDLLHSMFGDGFRGFDQAGFGRAGGYGDGGSQFRRSSHEDGGSQFRRSSYGDGGSQFRRSSYGDAGSRFRQSRSEYGWDFGSQPFPGQDVTAKIDLTFDEAVHGCDKLISYENEKGQIQTLQVHIPAGIDTGKKIRLAGKGTEGRNGGKPGDLYIEAKVGSRDGYERKGNDIYTSIQIPFTTAVLGGEAIVPTLYGDVRCHIKEGTQSGSKIRLRGKGVADMARPQIRGDQYVTIQIQVPKQLNPEARKKLREFQKAV